MTKIFQLKIALNGTKPTIWRRVLVKDSISFYRLHMIIQNVMGWWNSHLHEFSVNGLRIGDPYDDDTGEVTDSKKVRLEEFLSHEKQIFTYIYDFGDNWEHIILIEKTLERDPSKKYPFCIAAKRNCPPEDCGGIWGYENLLKILQNKNHKEHKEMLDWVGGKFDSEHFDLEEVNKNL